MFGNAMPITDLPGMMPLGQPDRDAIALGPRGSFARALDQAQTDRDTEQRVREAAEQLVGQTLYLPLLKAARENPFKSDLFHGGRGEEAFGAQMDQILADRMARRDSHGLVDAITQRYQAGKVN